MVMATPTTINRRITLDIFIHILPSPGIFFTHTEKKKVSSEKEANKKKEICPTYFAASLPPFGLELDWRNSK